MEKDELQSLLGAISRAQRAEQRKAAAAAGLPEVQWAILRYLEAANRYSNTPLALAEYLALTKGTVSQSLKRLEQHGWVRRLADTADGRVVRLILTQDALDLLRSADEPDWQAVLAAIDPDRRRSASTALRHALAEWQRARGGRSFGVCRSCAHFRQDNDGLRCGLTREALSASDATRICREHAVS